jgi:DNA mismatch repair protein MutS2
MNAKSIITLELPKVLERLAQYAAFSASKELALALEPSTDREEVSRRLKETAEARHLLSLNAELSVGGAHDVRALALAARRGSVLETADYLDIKSTMISARRLKRLLEDSSVEAALLAGYASCLEPVPGLIDAISRTIDDRGNIVDSASEKLGAVRREMRVLQDRLMSKMQRLVSDPKIERMLQEPIITQRDGRFVLPLRAEYKSQFQSVVHDRSSSGATLFVEPLSVVDLNNQVRELELEERDEIRRILAELSAFIGAHAETVIEIVKTLAKLDVALAKARYAEALDAHEPVLRPWEEGAPGGHPGSTIKLLGARHPLLDPQQVVPIDLRLQDETYALVITGPNTGGKTVALKTAGLLALMTQCGLHIPAESGSELSIFEGVFADIGDEQSIEQSLSTFSSHISNIIQILEHLGDRSLVLLDELGAGTDPQEGSALARALLSQFMDRGCTTLVATHYPELKSYAHITPGVRNASVEFDLESLQPTYHLTIGLPGRSNALAIAERLGLEASIVEKAREAISPDDLRAEGLLDEIHRERDAARQARVEAEIARGEADGLRDELRARLETIEEERREILEQARQEVEAELNELRAEVRAVRRQLAAAAQPLEVVDKVEETLDVLEEQIAEPIPRAPSQEGMDLSSLQLGDRVRLRSINANGVITGLTQSEAEVQIGRLRVKARLEELAAPGGVEVQDRLQEHRGPFGGGVQRAMDERIAQAPPLELDLRGLTVEEALSELDRRLDAAYNAGMPFIRVIHGKGTGRLRQAVRQVLKGNPYVSSFEAGHPSEGGEGVTNVRLDNA